MQFLKGLVINCIGNCIVMENDKKCCHSDGSSYYEKVLCIKKDDNDLKKVKKMFDSINITFKHRIYGRFGCTGKKIEYYELYDFRSKNNDK